MGKTDILTADFYLKKLVCVIKSQINNCTKPIYVNGRHSHAFVYIVSGICSYNFNNEYEVAVNQGDILYLARKAEYTMHIHTPEYRFIYCDFELNDDVIRKSNVYTPQNTSNVENQFIKLVKTYNTVSKISFSKCMSLIYNIHSIIIMTSEQGFEEKSTKNKIAKTKEYIDTHFADDMLSVPLLAEVAEISEVYLRKLFKQQYHMSPAQYLISVRIKKAKQLLKYRFLTLDECASQCGFSTVQYLCRVFKKSTGMTPSEYRNQKQ